MGHVRAQPALAHEIAGEALAIRLGASDLIVLWPGGPDRRYAADDEATHAAPPVGDGRDGSANRTRPGKAPCGRAENTVGQNHDNGDAAAAG